MTSFHTPPSIAIPCERHVLPNGIRLIVVPVLQRYSVAISLHVDVGSRSERANETGISHFLEHLVFKGGSRWTTGKAVSEAIESIGGGINAATDKEETMFWSRVPSAHWKLGLDVVSDIALSPGLVAAEVSREKQVVVEEIRMYRDSPQDYVDTLFEEAMWPDHPLGRDVAGDEESVYLLNHDRIVAFHESRYRPEHMVLTVAGAIDADAVVAYCTSTIGQWMPIGDAVRVELFPPTKMNIPFVWNQRQSEQANVVFGLPGISYLDPRRFALDVGQTIFGDGMSSRLFQRIREELGLVYDVHSMVQHHTDAGAFGVEFACEPANVEEAFRGCLEIMRNMATDGVTETEVQKAQDYIIGNFVLSLEESGTLCQFFGEQELLMTQTYTPMEMMDRIQTVTAKDVKDILYALQHAGKLTVAVDGPLDSGQRVEEMVEQYNAHIDPKDSTSA